MFKGSDATSVSRSEPSFTRATPGDGAKYLDLMEVYCLIHHPEIVPWLGGCIHLDMLEFAPEFSRRANLARRGGTYRDTSGQLVMVDQTYAEYKAILYAEVTSDLTITWTEAKIVEALYPKSMAKSRADNRAKLLSSAQAFLGKAMLLWPVAYLKDLMRDYAKLQLAVRTLDLVAFVNALKAFCLEGSGNQESNRRIAEEHISNLKMLKGRFPSYIRDFKSAAEDLERCGSTFSHERIVTLLIKNLDQKVFVAFYLNFLDKNHHLHSLKSTSLQAAIEVLCDHYDSVVRVFEDDDSAVSYSEHKHPITSFKSLKANLSNSASDSITVSHTVLAALVNQATQSSRGEKRKIAGEASVSKKFKGVGSKGDGPKRSEGDGELSKPKKQPCFAFAKGDVCTYGSKCRFEH